MIIEMSNKMAKDDKGYEKVANTQDLQEGSLLKVEYAGNAVVLSMVNGKVYAIDAVCSHEGGPLEDGTLEGYVVECPWHGRSEEHTSELQSHHDLVCRLLLEKKKQK